MLLAAGCRTGENGGQSAQLAPLQGLEDDLRKLGGDERRPTARPA